MYDRRIRGYAEFGLSAYHLSALGLIVVARRMNLESIHRDSQIANRNSIFE
jgi:hypothetical protein